MAGVRVNNIYLLIRRCNSSFHSKGSCLNGTDVEGLQDFLRGCPSKIATPMISQCPNSHHCVNADSVSSSDACSGNLSFSCPLPTQVCCPNSVGSGQKELCSRNFCPSPSVPGKCDSRTEISVSPWQQIVAAVSSKTRFLSFQTHRRRSHRTSPSGWKAELAEQISITSAGMQRSWTLAGGSSAVGLSFWTDMSLQFLPASKLTRTCISTPMNVSYTAMKHNMPSFVNDQTSVWRAEEWAGDRASTPLIYGIISILENVQWYFEYEE